MRQILRITNTHALTAPDSIYSTEYLTHASHRYFYFAEYEVDDDGNWHEGQAYTAVVSVEQLMQLLDDQGLLKNVTRRKQSGG